MTEDRDHHATIFVPPDVARQVEAARREWDPVMAAHIAAHVTVAYPEEAPNLDLLVERLRAATATIAPFRLRLGGFACFTRPEDGVYIAVDDVDGGYRRLREEMLRPPFHPLAFPPHVTIVHPRTSRRGRDFWDRGRCRTPGVEFTPTELAITAFDGARWVVRMTFPLERPRTVATERRPNP